MKKFLVFCLLISMLSGFSLVFAEETGVNSIQDPLVTTSSSNCIGVDAETALLGTAKLTDNVKSAFLYDVKSDTLMYAWNADEQMDPASLVKILTAYIAVEQGNLNDVVIVKEDVLATVPYDAVSAELLAGEELLLQDLLYCMMVGSANDAAAVIAEHICGSQETFVQEMNRYAQALNCSNTVFKNVHGLYAEEQVTTARDITKILAAALKNEDFSRIFSTVDYTVPATNLSEERMLSTGNYLINTAEMQIYYDERVKGGRTGVAQDGTRCLAAVSESDSLQMISIVLGAESVYADDGRTVTTGGFKETSQLLDAGFSGYKNVQLLSADQAVIQCPVVEGKNDVVLGVSVDLNAVLPVDVNLPDLIFRYNGTENIKAPIEKGQKNGVVEVWYGTMCVARADLYAMNKVQETEQIIDNEGQNSNSDFGVTKLVLTWVFGISGASVALALCIHYLPMLIQMRHAKKYRKSRRRNK